MVAWLLASRVLFAKGSEQVDAGTGSLFSKRFYREIRFSTLEFTLNAVTVSKISPMPKYCSAPGLSLRTTTPNSGAVTGSTIATMDAVAGAVWFRPTI